MLSLWRWIVWRKEENLKEKAKRVKEKGRTPRQKEKVGTTSRAGGMTSLKEKERGKERARTALTTKENQKEKDSKERKPVSTAESLDTDRLTVGKDKRMKEREPARKEGVQEEDLESERPHDAVLVQLRNQNSSLHELHQNSRRLSMEKMCSLQSHHVSSTDFPKPEARRNALEVAKKCQDDLVRHGEAIPLPKDVSPQEKEQHELTHLPKAPWCESCTATKSREDTHKRAGLKDIDDRMMVHIDFGYITGEPQGGDERAPSTTFLCAVESQTKWVVAIPVPSKDKYGLKYVVQQLVNATAGYGDINLLIRTDQEPALKQIARTWQSSRAAMKLKSNIQLVAVGQHQGLLSERYIQTVRLFFWSAPFAFRRVTT